MEYMPLGCSDVGPDPTEYYSGLCISQVYSMAQASKAILPRDVGGPWGTRIQSTVGGELSWALRVNAFVTGRTNSSDWLRYSLVVLNCEFAGRFSSMIEQLNGRAFQGTIVLVDGTPNLFVPLSSLGGPRYVVFFHWCRAA
jgi:hypothetical protein